MVDSHHWLYFGHVLLFQSIFIEAARSLRAKAHLIGCVAPVWEAYTAVYTAHELPPPLQTYAANQWLSAL